MRFLAAAAATIATIGTAALASGPGIPYEPPVSPPPVIASQYNWTGGYLGMGITYGRGAMTMAPDILPDTTGAGLGVIAGYNWQNGNFVYGGEVALDFSRRSGTNDCSLGLPWQCDTFQNHHASIRARAGIAMDRTLVFGTVGYATDTRAITVTNGIITASAARRYSGPMLGVGVEHALSNVWTVRGDFEHYFLGTETFGATPVSADTNLVRFSVVRRF